MKEKHFGIYGFIKSEDKVLLIKKGRGPYTGLWDLPGGSQEYGEEIITTLRREILEETGLTILNYKLLDVLSIHIKLTGDNEFFHTGVIYEVKAELNSNIKSDEDGEDSLGSKWFNEEEIKDIKLTPFAEIILK